VSDRWSGLRFTVPFAVAFLCLHASGTYFLPHSGLWITYLSEFLASTFALVACIWYARWRAVELRTNWLLLASGLLLFTIGLVVACWADMVAHASRNIAFLSDFFFFFYGAPVLFAVSLVPGDRRTWPFAWIDGLQAIIAGILAYIQIFAVIPFASHAAEPMPVSVLVRTYNIENLVLAGAATLRLLSCSRGTEARRFYSFLSLYLWSYALFIGVYNFLDVASTKPFGVHDILADMPFLILGLLVLREAGRNRKIPVHGEQKSSLTIFIENGSSVVFTFALLALGASVMKTNYTVGLSAIALALLLYGLRATLLQSRYVESQQELQKARDRLEALSLQDALTGIANRRCFDLTLEVEWNRAVRMQQPMSLLMLDVDHFKRLNDEYGHRAGDERLVQIALALQACLMRSGDLLARYGGEEFAVILPATGRAGAERVAQRMSEAVRDLKSLDDSAEDHSTTISIGVAIYEFGLETSFMQLLDAADAALYRAKQNGRDRVEYADIESAETAPAN
jgi:diguanylate cyclase (GGDEF)-like protein